MELYRRKVCGCGFVKRIKVLFWFVLFLAPCFSFAQQLDEQTVLKMVSEMDHAISQRDASGFARFLSAELPVIANIRASGQTAKIPMNTALYMDFPRQGFPFSKSYEYKRTDM